MDFDDGEGGVGEGVAEGKAVVGEGAGVDNNAVGGIGLGLEEVDDCAFVVGLEEGDINAEFRGASGDGSLYVGKGLGTVLGRVSLAEPIKIGAVDNQDSPWGSAEDRALGWAFS